MLKYDWDWEQAKLLDDHAAFPKGGYFKWEKEFQAQLWTNLAKDDAVIFSGCFRGNGLLGGSLPFFQNCLAFE